MNLSSFRDGLDLPKLARAARLSQHGAKVVGLILAYAVEASVAKLRIRDRQDRLRFFSRNVGKWTKRCLEAMNFEVQVFGYDRVANAEKSYLLVGNHLSYLDILVTSSVTPTVFVTSVDMGEQPFLGDMAELGGSIFVERRNRNSIGRDLGVMADTLRAGHNVMLYPEGTSSNGEGILPFKKSLLMAAVEAKVEILPVCIKYVEIDGEPFGPETRDNIAWYGDMDFASHFVRVLRLKHVKVELHFLEPIKVTDASTRQDLAEQAYKQLNECYHQHDQKRGQMPASTPIH